jgi:site-specific DNA-methyltransferase (adenine-specific)
LSPRVERFGDAVLYLGDCREILSGMTVDHIITDPPYEDELHKAFGSARKIRTDGKNRSRHEDLGFVGVNTDRALFAKLMVSASNGWLIAFSLAEGIRAWRDDIQAVDGKWDQTLFWIKPDSTPRFNGQGPARGAECAAAAWCGPGYRSWNAGGKRGVYTHCVNVDRQGEHPTEKPLPLMMDLVADFTQHGQTICDPFMGSGTTGIACVNLGRSFIGIEQSEQFFDLACRRIEEAYKQPRLFAEPKAEPVQQSMFPKAAR